MRLERNQPKQVAIFIQKARVGLATSFVFRRWTSPFPFEPMSHASSSYHSLFRLILWLPVLALWTACVTPAHLPPAHESERFETLESGFSIAARNGAVRFAVTLLATPPFEEPLFLTVSYENPADPSEPHLEQIDLPAGESLVFLESPPLRNLEAGKTYHIQVDIFLTAEREERLDFHEVLIFSTVETKRHGR